MCIVCVGLLSGQLSVQLCCLSVQPNFAHFIIFITVLHECFYGLNKVELSWVAEVFEELMLNVLQSARRILLHIQRKIYLKNGWSLLPCYIHSQHKIICFSPQKESSAYRVAYLTYFTLVALSRRSYAIGAVCLSVSLSVSRYVCVMLWAG